LRGRAIFGIVAEPSCDPLPMCIRRACLMADIFLILHVSKDVICPSAQCGAEYLQKGK
jgi:hypothetical protein